MQRSFSHWFHCGFFMLDRVRDLLWCREPCIDDSGHQEQWSQTLHLPPQWQATPGGAAATLRPQDSQNSGVWDSSLNGWWVHRMCKFTQKSASVMLEYKPWRQLCSTVLFLLWHLKLDSSPQFNAFPVLLFLLQLWFLCNSLMIPTKPFLSIWSADAPAVWTREVIDVDSGFSGANNFNEDFLRTRPKPILSFVVPMRSKSYRNFLWLILKKLWII